MTKLDHNASGGMGGFHVMAKPVGSACNLDCTYCYYLSKAHLPGGPASGRMDDETLERFIRQYIESCTTREVVFSWQGGEPALAALDFYRKVIGLQKKYARPGQRVENDLQTNGTLLDEEWVAFLKEHRFLVGLSIDGPRPLHDPYRMLKGGAPSFDKVVAAATLLRRYGVPFNTLTCVHRFNARRPLDVYRFLRRELGSTYLQFIPIVEHRDFRNTAPQRWDEKALPKVGDPEAHPGTPGSIVTEWSVSAEDWGYFLCRVFDEWRARDLGKVFVNQIETLVAQHLGLPSQMCVFSPTCGKAFALEHDGSLFACDHYVYPEYRLGNIRENPLSALTSSETQRNFGYAKSASLPGTCRACAFLKDCWGECPKNRLLRTERGEPGLNYLCEGLKRYFEHALPEIERIVANLRRQEIRPIPRM